MKTNSNILTLRQLERRCRKALYRELVREWHGTRGALRAAIRRTMRMIARRPTQGTRPMRHKIAWMLRVVREARFAALVAGTVLTMGLTGTAGASPTIELSDIVAGTGGFVIDGESLADFSGRSVSGAGDVNGDGLADLIVGAPAADPFGFGSGRSYVVFGKAGGTSVQLSDITAGTGGFAIDGETFPDGSGSGVSAAGDVNGDGLADLLVGAPAADPNGNDGSGSSYVVFGKATGTLVRLTDIAAGTGGFAIDGVAEDDSMGQVLSGAGDVNGDGLADLIFGVFQANPDGFSFGRSYVVFGKTSGSRVQLSDVQAGTGGFAINGEASNDSTGRSVSGAGDVNGDGLDDLIVGARRSSYNGALSGSTFVVFGKTSGTLVRLSDVAAGTGGFAIRGEATSDRSGYAVSTAGDVNGDGFADLIVGALFGDTIGSYSGRNYVVFGKNTGAPVELSNVTAGTGGFTIHRAPLGDRAANSVSAAGDVNGDGLADLIIGAYRAEPNGTFSGQSYVVFGKTSGASVQLSDVIAGVGGFAMNGEIGQDISGFSVSGAGDVNGDGLADVIVAAPGAESATVSESGRSYVVFSPESPPLTPPSGLPASATYVGRSRAGDGAGGDPVVPTLVGDSRCTIDFSDDDSGDDGSGGASTETVVLTRSKSGITNLTPIGDVADVLWQVTTDRTGFTDAKVTLKYLDSEIAGISGTESELSIFRASAASGPWTELASTVDAARNEISVTTTGFSFFAIANGTSVPVELSGFEID